jgi:hypothetical protein
LKAKLAKMEDGMRKKSVGVALRVGKLMDI